MKFDSKSGKKIVSEGIYHKNAPPTTCYVELNTARVKSRVKKRHGNRFAIRDFFQISKSDFARKVHKRLFKHS